MQLKRANGMLGSNIILADLAGVENVMECSIDKIVQLDYIYHNESPKYSAKQRGSGSNLPIEIDNSILNELRNKNNSLQIQISVITI